MRKLYFLSIAIILISFGAKAQTGGHDIKFNIKGLKDTTMYLAKYYFDQTVIIDSSKHIKNGAVRFKGDDVLPKGVYILVTQERGRYIDFLVDDTQKFSINGDNSDLMATVRSPESKENDELLAYARFMTGLDKRYKKAQEETKGKSKADSAELIKNRVNAINEDVKKFDASFMAKNKGTFVYDFMNLRTEKYPPSVPKASNGRPDSNYQYYWYKSHYFDGVNFKDERIMYTPFFATRLKKYFDEVLLQNPDTVIKAIDMIMSQCVEGSELYTTLLGHFTYKYESSKLMTLDGNGNMNNFEKVFIHLADKYITNGKAFGYYSDETIKKIKEKVDILRNLQPNVKVPDLLVMDTTDGKEVLKMGFDTARTSPGVTALYNKNMDRINSLFKNLYGVKAKYTVLVFWAADCGHCKTEIPKLNEALKEIKGKIDYKVFAVQTKEELFGEWKKIIIEQKLSDFINVFDPVHINNTKEKFDINATPAIYVLDKDKRIKGKKVSSEQVVDILKNLEKLDKKP